MSARERRGEGERSPTAPATGGAGGAVGSPLPPAVAESPFLRACRGLPTAHTPIWLMRQAGRYLPEYRALRERRAILEIIATPELAVEITLQPMRRFDLDAAIIFADILPPLRTMGLEISFGGGEGGEGPAIANPIRSTRDIDLLACPPAVEGLGPTLEAIRLVREELDRRGKPLIGFAGAPFTLASYAIEGGGSRTYARTKALMHGEPAAWRRLMTKLVTVQADFLAAQAKAGAAALQIFDSWAGVALGPADYRRSVQPYNRRLIEALAPLGVPIIHFSTGTGGYIEEVAACGGEVIGVDWRLELDDCWSRVGADRAIQGNLDPGALLAPWRELSLRAGEVLDAAAGRPGHIFNLGHGVYPETPVDSVKRLVDFVHERSAR